MVIVGAFPVAKLAYLALRQVSKPISNFIQKRAKETPFFRKYVCMPPAQFYHMLETKLQFKTLGLGGGKAGVKVTKLSEDNAVDLGAQMLGEFIVFFVGAACIYMEYSRQAGKTASKEETLTRQLETLQNTMNEHAIFVEMQTAKLKDLEETLSKLAKK